MSVSPDSTPHDEVERRHEKVRITAISDDAAGFPNKGLSLTTEPGVAADRRPVKILID